LKSNGILSNISSRMLNEDRGPVLDDDEFFDTLQNSKKSSQVVKESLEIAETTEIDINSIREGKSVYLL
jgi:dynein heavy chain